MKKTENNCIRQEADVEQIQTCRDRIGEVEHSIDLLANSMDMLGNKVRLQILFLLNEQTKLCVCDISDVLEMKIPAISQHLRKLKDRGIINGLKKGTTIYYFLSSEYAELFEHLFERINKGEVLKIAK